MSQHVLVTGAGGFLARHVVPAVLAEGADVTATGRGPRPEWLQSEVAYVRADLTSVLPAELFGGVNRVIHLAGASSSRSSVQDMALVNVSGTEHIVQAMLAHSPHARLVHVSSTSVYGEETQLPLPVNEDGPAIPSRPYGQTKLAGEQVVSDALKQGLQAVVVRPVTVFGAYNTKLVASAILDASLERAEGLTQLELPGPPTELRLVHASDAAAALVHLGMRCGDEVLGRAFNVCLPQFPTSHSLGAAIAAALGMGSRVVADESPGLSLEQRRSTWARVQRSAGLVSQIILTPRRLAFLTRPNPNNRLSVDALVGTGFTFERTDLAADLADLVAWYTERRWIAP